VRLSLAPLTNFDVGALLAALIAFAAWRTRSLTAGGAIGAFLVGTATFGALGLPGAYVLLAFFVSSVALSRVGKARKAALVDAGKHGARDGTQVFANGGVAALCAVLSLGGDPRFAAAFAGAFAAAAADTWATEIGTLIGGRPRSILTLRTIATGLSGGVTVAGTLASFAGAMLLAAVAALAGFGTFGAIALAGIAGSLADSVLGASVQSLRWCPQCERACESDPHACGANTRPIRGAAWFGNDAVNFSATLAGALVAFALSARPG
jgi:uncharacterized protein (TIGR00297 family)